MPVSRDKRRENVMLIARKKNFIQRFIIFHVISEAYLVVTNKLWT